MKPDVRDDNVVVLARLRGEVSYAAARELLASLFREAGWDAARADGASWNPFGELIEPGNVVVIKPNWVHHENQAGQGMDCMLTHAAVIDAVVELVLRARPRRVIVGDAPIQGCDFELLKEYGGYRQLEARYAAEGAPVEWADFRRTIRDETRVLPGVRSEIRPEEDYVLFDVAGRSLLEPISGDAEKFRVAMYNPDLMLRNHAPGRHRYLIARDILEADVVINLPKLKTHKKAGITGALKNLVGINGNKEFLPHHRVGGTGMKGDCYAGKSRFKYLGERLLDASNRRSGAASLLFLYAARAAYRAARATGADPNMEGSWYGNDTIWRTCLDLNRVFLYGRADGTLGDTPVRRVLTITDAIVCGEGDGPLAPTPHPLGILTLATNSAAAELVHAFLMGFDWRKVPIVREAFGDFDLPIVRFRPEDVELWFEGARSRQPWPALTARPFVAPQQWRGHCELDPAGANRVPPRDGDRIDFAEEDA